MPSWLITGASRGLGYAWLTYLAENPLNVVFGTVRTKAPVQERLAGFKNVHLLVADVTDHRALEAAADEISKITGGKLDYLINNAALVSARSGYKTLLEDTPQDLEDDLMNSFKTNVVGAAHTINAFLPLIRSGKEKKVVVISTGLADDSITRLFDLDTASPYAISKAATNTLVAKYHAALGKKERILFLALSPGLVDTSEGKTYSQEELDGQAAMGAKFAAYAPDFSGPITTRQSVEAQLEVISKATVETLGGDFVSHHGDKNWL